MLSAGSFSSPYEHLSQPETKRMVEHYTAYLSDNTRLIANPGLKVHIHTAQCQPEPEVTHKHVLSYTSLSPEWQRTRHYRNQAWRYTNAHYKKKKKNWRDGLKEGSCEILWDCICIFAWQLECGCFLWFAIISKHQSVTRHASATPRPEEKHTPCRLNWTPPQSSLCQDPHTH